MISRTDQIALSPAQNEVVQSDAPIKIVVGDRGSGKTLLCIRAAQKAMSDGKYVAFVSGMGRHYVQGYLFTRLADAITLDASASLASLNMLHRPSGGQIQVIDKHSLFYGKMLAGILRPQVLIVDNADLFTWQEFRQAEAWGLTRKVTKLILAGDSRDDRRNILERLYRISQGHRAQAWGWKGWALPSGY